MPDYDSMALRPKLLAALEASGLADVIGGRRALEAGLDELRIALLPIASELLVAAEKGVDLATAVLDIQQFPHLSEMHGRLSDALDEPAPAELKLWLRKVVAMGPLPGMDEVSFALAAVATASKDAARRLLARFVLFELVCLHQRLRLRTDGVQLEAINGRRHSVEVLAESEVDAATELAASSADLLATPDPLGLVLTMAEEALGRHVEMLRAELRSASRDVHDQLERRRRILDAAARVGPADALLIINETANEFGEERLTAVQLRRAHPGLLGPLSDSAIYKNVERLPERLARGVTRAPSLADVIIEIMEEVQS